MAFYQKMVHVTNYIEITKNIKMIKLIEDKELCIKLKEAGFDEGCVALFRGMSIKPVCQMNEKLSFDCNSELNDETNYWLACPTYDQAIEWLEREHNFFFERLYNELEKEGFIVWKDKKPINMEQFNDLNQAITEALKLI